MLWIQSETHQVMAPFEIQQNKRWYFTGSEQKWRDRTSPLERKCKNRPLTHHLLSKGKFYYAICVLTPKIVGVT